MKKPKKFIQSAIKRPGRMKRLAKKEGVSVHEAEEKASHSSNKSLASAGRLGLRFGKGGDLHPKKHREKKTGIHYSRV